MASDPEKPRNQSPQSGSDPVQWQTPENRDPAGDRTSPRGSESDRDVETDRPSRSSDSI